MKDAGKALTVLGPVEPERLGTTVTHEHIFFDWGDTYWTEPQTEDEKLLADAPFGSRTEAVCSATRSL